MIHAIDELEGDKLSYLVAKCMNLNMDDAGTFATWTGRVGKPGGHRFDRSVFEPHYEFSHAAEMLEEMAKNSMGAGSLKNFPGVYVCIRSLHEAYAPTDSALMHTWIAQGDTFLLAACRAYCKWKRQSEDAEV